MEPLAWIEPVEHMSQRKVCARVKWISVTTRISSRVFNLHFGTFGKYSGIFGQIRLSKKLNKCHFTSLHVTSRLLCRVFNPHFGTFGKYSDKFGFEKFNKCHFTIIMSCVESTIRKIRLSGKIGLRITFALGHTLFFFAWIKFEFFVIFWLRSCFHHNICHYQIHKKFFKISFWALSGL